MKKGLTYTLFLGLLCAMSCVTPPDYPIEPTLEFVSNSKLEMIQGNQFEDTILIVVAFTDGDGDIGSDDGPINLSLIDSRTGLEAQSYKIPEIPNPNEKYGINGEILITVYTVCCQHPTLMQICDVWDDFPVDELYYDITLTDRAGNVSNSVSTDPIRILCQ